MSLDDGTESKKLNIILKLEQNPDYSAHPPIITWHSRPVGKAAYYLHLDSKTSLGVRGPDKPCNTHVIQESKKQVALA